MLTELPWLARPTPEFRASMRALLEQARREVTPQVEQRAVELATLALDENQLHSLSRVVPFLAAAKTASLSRVKLGLVGDGTLSLKVPALIGTALRHGIVLDVIEGGYNSAVQEALDPGSPIHQAQPDFLLVATDYRMMGLDGLALSGAEASELVGRALEKLQLLVDNFGRSVKSTILLQTLVPPKNPSFGQFDRVEVTSPFAMVDAVNLEITKWARDKKVGLVDTARLAASVGIERWFEERHWHASKLSIAPQFIPQYAEAVMRVVAAYLGKSRKCLVLDLDNTLWGGVIGDDGLDGITLGQGSAAGEAFLATQRLALQLRARGIILAVCSKNEDSIARTPFRQHPEMLLKEDHIAVFQANWTDKASNLRAIAQTLNIGLDALVFLDDNPAERMQVRGELPMVAVPELPDDPSLFAEILAAAGYFESVSFSAEDLMRSEQYASNARRAASLAASQDLEGYLKSLDMRCEIGRITPVTRPRVAQLINKSNQFNLTTRRCTEQEVAKLEADPRFYPIQIRLQDRFGDNGIISVIVAEKHPEHWELIIWLMSCRVLGRRVEEAALRDVAVAAQAAGAKKLIGRYIPTAKNIIVKDHYKKLGFELAGTEDGEITIWSRDLTTYQPPQLPFTFDEAIVMALNNA